MLALGRVDMDREDACKNRLEAMTQFQIDGQLMREEPYGHGHINDTFLLTFLQRDENILRVILQRMNMECNFFFKEKNYGARRRSKKRNLTCH